MIDYCHGNDRVKLIVDTARTHRRHEWDARLGHIVAANFAARWLGIWMHISRTRHSSVDILKYLLFRDAQNAFIVSKEALNNTNWLRWLAKSSARDRVSKEWRRYMGEEGLWWFQPFSGAWFYATTGSSLETGEREWKLYTWDGEDWWFSEASGEWFFCRTGSQLCLA